MPQDATGVLRFDRWKGYVEITEFPLWLEKIV
jgi:hypothetical protein